MKNLLVVGSGAREHALLWKLRQSPEAGRLYCAPGNAGTAEIAHNSPIGATDVQGIVRLAREADIDLAVVGPEEPLALGLADALRAEGCAVVGPSAAAARIEASKSFAKELMCRSGIPTPTYRTFDSYDLAAEYVNHVEFPVAIKADGLARGKGVTICHDPLDATSTLRALMRERAVGAAGKRVIVEQVVTGDEISLMALCDGKHAIALPPARDHKRLQEGDAGPNTGGMGAYAPVPTLDDRTHDQLLARTIVPVLEALSAMGTPFTGILFAGLMLTPDGPYVLEYNCRPGDPETQAVLPALDGDLLPYLEGLTSGRLPDTALSHRGAAVGVVLASPGYPRVPALGSVIDGLDRLPAGVLAFHGGTARDERDRTVTAGGRVLTLVGLGASIPDAAARAYATEVTFEDAQCRRDIGRDIPVRGLAALTAVAQ